MADNSACSRRRGQRIPLDRCIQSGPFDHCKFLRVDKAATDTHSSPWHSCILRIREHTRRCTIHKCRSTSLRCGRDSTGSCTRQYCSGRAFLHIPCPSNRIETHPHRLCIAHRSRRAVTRNRLDRSRSDCQRILSGIRTRSSSHPVHLCKFHCSCTDCSRTSEARRREFRK